MPARWSFTAALTIALCAGPALAQEAPPTPEQVAEVLAAAAGRPFITVEEVGRSAGDRPLLAAHLDRSAGTARWRVLLVGGQHGDEPAGYTALTELVRGIDAVPSQLPDDVDLWVVPLLNPDGAAAGARANAAGADLNRDHLVLAQPETRALHDLARRIRPHLVVDHHEFDRTSPDYLERGWVEWPDVTMDTANHPLLPDAVYEAGLAWVEAAAPALQAEGLRYGRYTVGGPPPRHEQRPSTLEADDARNGLALYGSLGFIVESGVSRAAGELALPLERRVAAHLALVRRFLAERDLRGPSVAAVGLARGTELPPFLPVNALWGSSGGRVTEVPVLDRSSGVPHAVATANLMLDRVVKRFVTTPLAYVVEAAHAAPFRALLAAHGVAFEELATPTSLRVEGARLERLEEAWDPVHARYAGRQVVTLLDAVERTLPAGSILVFLDRPAQRWAVPLLEPAELYGVYQDAVFRATVGAAGELPVWRVLGAS